MNTEGYTKLLPRIVRSTIWFEEDHVLRVWIAFMALVDKNGYVSGSVPGMAHISRVTVEQFEEAIEKLKSPDPHSTTKDNEGRRIKEVDQGWVLLNFKTIRDQLTEEERKEYQRNWDRENRGKKKGKNSEYLPDQSESSTGNTGKRSIWELTKIIEAKESEAAKIKNDNAFEDAMGLKWKNIESHRKHIALMKEIECLKRQIGDKT